MAKTLPFVDDTNVFENALNGWMEQTTTPSALADLDRSPRVLVIGESILNTDTLNTQLQAAMPGIQIDRRTYGGSQSPLGLLLTAGDVQARITPGNLLKYSDLSHWPSKVNMAVAADVSPTTGRAVWKLTGDGTAQQHLDTFTSDGVTVPAGPPARMVFSVLVEPGTLKSLRLLAFNSTKAGNIASQDFQHTQSDALGNLPARYTVSFGPTDGVGYAAGDVLRFYLYVGANESWAAGSVYVSEPMVNVGEFPASYAATSGTAQTAGAEGWAVPPFGTSRHQYDLVVIQWGRNDRVGMPFADHGRVLAAQIAGAARQGSRVLVCTCPPQATSDLTAWDTGNDLYQTSPYLPEARRVARQAGARFYDAVADFTESGLAVSALMVDQYHPTKSGAALGTQRYTDQIVAALTSPVDPPVRALANPPTLRLGGDIVSGTWTWQRFTSATLPMANVDGVVAGHLPSPLMRGFASSTAGDKLSVAITGSLIGLVAIADSASAGQVDVQVDGRSPVRVDLLKSGVTMYPQGYHILGGLPDTSHTVTITVVSGQARIVGVVAA